LDDYLKLICFLSTSVYSALGVSAIMRYINRRFTYLLTYQITSWLPQ